MKNYLIKFNWRIYLILFSIPFIQLGVSYYLSVFFLVFLFILIASFKFEILNNKFFNLFIVFTSIVFINKFLLLHFSNIPIRNSLVPIRELICFIGIYLISISIRSKSLIDFNKLGFFIIFILCLIFIIVLIQLFFFSSGIYFGLPQNWFVINQGTLLGADNALYYGTRFRPVSFYGEPSYTGWIVLSLLTIVLSRVEFSLKYKYFVLVLSIIIVSLSQAFSGILSIFVLTLYWLFIKSKNKVFSLISALFFVVFISFILINFSSEFESRFLSILSSDDVSFNIRILSPLENLNNMLNDGLIFGLNNVSALEVDNAAISLILMYGFLFIPIILFFYLFINNNLVFIYLLLSLNFNGAFLRFDKVLILSLVIGLSYQSLYSNNRIYVVK